MEDGRQMQLIDWTRGPGKTLRRVLEIGAEDYSDPILGARPEDSMMLLTARELHLRDGVAVVVCPDQGFTAFLSGEYIDHAAFDRERELAALERAAVDLDEAQEQQADDNPVRDITPDEWRQRAEQAARVGQQLSVECNALRSVIARRLGSESLPSIEEEVQQLVGGSTFKRF